MQWFSFLITVSFMAFGAVGCHATDGQSQESSSSVQRESSAGGGRTLEARRLLNEGSPNVLVLAKPADGIPVSSEKPEGEEEAETALEVPAEVMDDATDGDVVSEEPESVEAEESVVAEPVVVEEPVAEAPAEPVEEEEVLEGPEAEALVITPEEEYERSILNGMRGDANLRPLTAADLQADAYTLSALEVTVDERDATQGSQRVQISMPLCGVDVVADSRGCNQGQLIQETFTVDEILRRIQTTPLSGSGLRVQELQGAIQIPRQLRRVGQHLESESEAAQVSTFEIVVAPSEILRASVFWIQQNLLPLIMTAEESGFSFFPEGVTDLSVFYSNLPEWLRLGQTADGIHREVRVDESGTLQSFRAVRMVKNSESAADAIEVLAWSGMKLPQGVSRTQWVRARYVPATPVAATSSATEETP